jgi:acyl-CoA thioesterase FadM
MAFIHRLTVQFEDVDLAQVVHFPRLFGFCHRTFEAFFPAEMGLSFKQMIDERRMGFPLVHAEGDFREPFRLSDTCRPMAAAQVQLVTALIGIQDFRPIAMPADLREALLRHHANE